ncbi:MAG TPA: ATP-dependent zinc metalloprotease FtsH [Gaiellaceae bacterium]|nr:ATP-dependent zinc metalloprotease FtsH [Gaiellaceae bacterium]
MNERRFPRLPSRPIRIAVYVAVLVVVLGINYWGAHRVIQETRIRVPYSPFFLEQVRADNVRSITSNGSELQGAFVHATKPASTATTSSRFVTEIPSFADTNQLSQLLQQHGVVVNAEPPDKGGPLWERLVLGFGPTIVLLLLLVWIFRRMSGSRTAGALGRTKARRYQPGRETVTFADVAGIDEAKQELTEIVDFLRDPDKYHQLGGRIPRGVLLSGPPGTGKTLLARAVAGEAGAPFFSMSASEFVEAIVGVGASRVRDLFRQAKKEAPAIVFIDELDAVGRARSTAGGYGGGSDEREQTLNQILTEMDGFDSSTHVIVIGATNRIDVLDQALLRPGRFDRRVVVQAPDREGRRLILEVHSRDVPLSSDVDLDRIAATTPGMVGADLANLVNEAALLAARQGHAEVGTADFTQSLEKIILGAERKIMLTSADRRRTAYHEAGHALVGMLTAGADPVRKITIVPRGQSLGVTLSSPDVDRFNYSRAELEARVKMTLGGRAAEETVFGDQTTGAEGDIAQVTALVRHMIGRWGMSERIGMVAVLPRDGANPWGELASPRTLELVDEEVRRTVESAYDDVMGLLAAERSRLDALADALLERETLDQIDAYRVAGLAEPDPAPVD